MVLEKATIMIKKKLQNSWFECQFEEVLTW